MKESRRIAGALLVTTAMALTLTAVPALADPITGQDHPADVFALAWQYFPATVTINQGETFKFGNYDPIQGIPAHSIDEVVPECTAPPFLGTNCPAPRFSSGLVDHGHVHEVHGTEKLEPGTYPFICQVHSFMYGELVVQ